jgi:hypothetical protein
MQPIARHTAERKTAEKEAHMSTDTYCTYIEQCGGWSADQRTRLPNVAEINQKYDTEEEAATAAAKGGFIPGTETPYLKVARVQDVLRWPGTIDNI